MDEWWMCANPALGARINPVDGKMLYRKCDIERSSATSACGPEGKQWESE